MLKEILTGGIIRSENTFEQQVLLKLKAGRRSAYQELCSHRRNIEYAVDLMVILFSLGLWMLVPIKVGMVLLGKVYEF